MPHLNIEWSLRTWYPQPQAFRQQENLLTSRADGRTYFWQVQTQTKELSTHIWYAAYNAGRMGVDFAGATPFWRAAYAQDVEAMKLLVKYGADHKRLDLEYNRSPEKILSSQPSTKVKKKKTLLALPPVEPTEDSECPSSTRCLQA